MSLIKIYNPEIAEFVKTILIAYTSQKIDDGARMQFESGCNELCEIGIGDMGYITDSVNDLFDSIFEITDNQK